MYDLIHCNYSPLFVGIIIGIFENGHGDLDVRARFVDKVTETRYPQLRNSIFG